MASVGGESGESLELNVTPMLDIFSILVTFLLMSYSTDPVNHDLKKGVELPESYTIVSLDEIPAISVTEDEIFINDKKVASLAGGDLEQKDISQGAALPVFKELEMLAEVNNKVFANAGMEEKKKLGTIGMEMHKKHNFKLVKRIMLAAQQAEFITFKLVVSKLGE